MPERQESVETLSPGKKVLVGTILGTHHLAPTDCPYQPLPCGFFSHPIGPVLFCLFLPPPNPVGLGEAPLVLCSSVVVLPQHVNQRMPLEHRVLVARGACISEPHGNNLRASSWQATSPTALHKRLKHTSSLLMTIHLKLGEMAVLPNTQKYTQSSRMRK